ncbi:MAG: efflux RND transporter periplasmic adaptor subunit [Proteiniphilum sp.]|nr:efflux RND transporter periplasmic adaptor subunit [Proteiniphilum sp.]
MKAAIQMPDDLFIRAGYSANADIILDSRDSVISVPESCITFENDSSFVYLAVSESPQEFNKKHVKVGLSDGIKIEIVDGLQENDKVRGNQVIETKK